MWLLRHGKHGKRRVTVEHECDGEWNELQVLERRIAYRNGVHQSGREKKEVVLQRGVMKRSDPKGKKKGGGGAELESKRRVTKTPRSGVAKGRDGGWARAGLTRSVRGNDGLGRDAHATVINRQLLAGQTLGPRVAVLDEDGLAALPGPLAHRLAGLDGLVLEVNGADGRIHGTEEEEQIRAALGAQQTFELLNGQDGVSLGAVVQVVGHLGHVPGQGLAQGDAHGLAGCSSCSGHPEQTERSQGEQPGPQQQHPSWTAADHDPGRTGQGSAVPRTPTGPLRGPLFPPWKWTQ